MIVEQPRIQPLGESELTEDARELLGIDLKGHKAEGAQGFFRTLVRHPGLYRRFAPFAGKLLVAGKLPARERELAILRCAWLNEAAFEWGEHVAIARGVGLTGDDFNRLRQGSDATVWTETEAAVLRAATASISDATWAVLAQSFNEQQLIELPFLVGAYQMIAYVQRALRVALPPGSAGLQAC